MALSGTIEVNGHKLYHWEALRVSGPAYDADKPSRYRCTVWDVRDPELGFQGPKVEFEHLHPYSAGSVALASDLLAIASTKLEMT